MRGSPGGLPAAGGCVTLRSWAWATLGATMKGWTLDDIPWRRFEARKVDADLLAVARAAAIVEHNGADYGVYLGNVFAGDDAFVNAAGVWAREEVRHGEALARWAAMADPSFDFESRFARFAAGYRLPLEARRSVRGSRSGELIARCVVEAATSSFYGALADAADEPVFRDICRRIAADEFRHYKLFHDTLKRYLESEGIGRWRRLWVALGRVGEMNDDELAYAWHCGNEAARSYNRRRSARAYSQRAFRAYRRDRFDLGFRMILKAAGVNPRGWMGRQAAHAGWRLMRWRARGLAAPAA